mmetsp:Transcript_13384/g.28261  ORF Transcript_13384/g.28261 Transcript_13384/m.28261 type:complete len:112 (-) Transcript_13384:212-547(-)|eukprot:CAMPEP_0119516914 /NCGR_PEP_ID=MMETSP1344-20130328/33968_1 /TAXON_ID=236787 /ORGANISM="Florenciella parvula, Strain CCMP2471" /LENGTH=111 /DNA_ID=CAMNT_0007554459 /DNA_START=153 /DNA_END=488 /DNA_ORIENTATION=+
MSEKPTSGISVGDATEAVDDDALKPKKGCLPVVSEEKRVPIGLLFVFIVAAGMTIFLHEHHHHRHNKWRGVERDLEYVMGSIAVFAPVAGLAYWAHLRNRHWDRVAEMKSL